MLKNVAPRYDRHLHETHDTKKGPTMLGTAPQVAAEKRFD
jgi:hypothetical protein